MIYKELMDEACDYVAADLTLKEFYEKHKRNVTKRNLLMKYCTIFSNLWKNHELLEDKPKEKYGLMEAMAIFLTENTKDNTQSQEEIDNTNFI